MPILTPAQVAARLGVSTPTAIQLIRELPHINISQNQYSRKPRLRITEETLNDYLAGKITRKRLRRGG